nr:hypothetical protein [Limnoglobus roseus]
MLFDDGRESDPARVGKVLAQEQVKHPALNVPRVAGEQPTFRLQSLPHFLEQQRQERRLELAGRAGNLGIGC